MSGSDKPTPGRCATSVRLFVACHLIFFIVVLYEILFCLSTIIDKYHMRYQDILQALREQALLEVEMSPGSLRKWAASSEAQGIQAGFEAEMIFTNTQGEDGGYGIGDDAEPDYERDERARSIAQVVEFFSNDEHYLGLTHREAINLEDKLRDEYLEWIEDQIMDVWDRDEFEEIMRDEGWYEELVQEELDGLEDNNDLDDDEKQERAEELVQERIENMWSRESGFYDDALETYRERAYNDSDYDEEEWLSQNYPYMTDFEGYSNLIWPFIEENTGPGEREWEEIANEISQVTGMETQVSKSYHGQRGNFFVIEPDSSLDPDSDVDAGIEVISPPMPLLKAVESLEKLLTWASKDQAYTNNSTGLHMGVSLPDLGGDVDYVKLILFLGDEYVLNQFNRAYNTYARSALAHIRDQVKASNRAVNTEEVLALLRKGAVDVASKMVRQNVGRDKYTSVHIKQGYLEFRSAGDDYLKMAKTDLDKILNTMLRYARAMKIAGSPDAYRQEYLKKLYKLIDSRHPELNLFAKYQAGLITKDELKSQWADQILQNVTAAQRKASGEREYHIVAPDDTLLKVIYARDDAEAIEILKNLEKSSMSYATARVVDPEKQRANTPPPQRSQDLAKRISAAQKKDNAQDAQDVKNRLAPNN